MERTICSTISCAATSLQLAEIITNVLSSPMSPVLA